MGGRAAPASVKSGGDELTVPIHAGGRSRRRWSPRTTRCCFANEVAAERGAAVGCGGGGWAACAPLLVRSSLGASHDARGGVMSELLLDAAGRRRSPATLPDFHAGRPPRNKGMRYPADPPTSRRSSRTCAARATASTAAG